MRAETENEESVEESVVLVKDIEGLQKRYDKIQSRIDAAELLGLGIDDYEKEASRPVRLAKGAIIGAGGKPLHIRIPRSKGERVNTVVCMGVDVWTKKESR